MAMELKNKQISTPIHIACLEYSLTNTQTKYIYLYGKKTLIYTFETMRGNIIS